MNLSDDCKILADGYIDEVCVNLPRKIRSDIAIEIRSMRDLFGRTTAGEWDPTTLATTSRSETVKRGEAIFGMAIIVLVAILFNFFHHKVGVYGVTIQSDPWFAPLLVPAFKVYLPWWNLY